MNSASFSAIRRLLREWYEIHARDLPWRHTRDPYKIWLSETILQQTRVIQGLPYYHKFIRRFPDVFGLAEADEEEIKKMWEGLGYYRRADYLHKTADIIARERKGQFPSDPASLRKLPGIGPYTAAAIASFAFNYPIAVIDANVSRVLARLSGEFTPVNTPQGQKKLNRLAQELLDRNNPALFNQSLMEFGALQCVPRNPDCTVCPLRDFCFARRHALTDKLPAKEPKKPLKHRYIHYLISLRNNRLAIRKRTGKDIWRGLYEFPGKEVSAPLTPSESGELLRRTLQLRNMPVRLTRVEHTLTHRKLHLTFWTTDEYLPDEKYVPVEQISRLAFPSVLRKILAEWINIPNFEAE